MSDRKLPVTEDLLDELYDATQARFQAVIALYTAFADATVGWDGSASGQQLEDACGREISALALAHARFLESNHALTVAADRGPQ
jgi:hypothetical protein